MNRSIVLWILASLAVICPALADGTVHFDAGNKDRAATDCTAAMRLDPEAYNGLTFQDGTGTFVCDAASMHYQQ